MLGIAGAFLLVVHVCIVFPYGCIAMMYPEINQKNGTSIIRFCFPQLASHVCNFRKNTMSISFAHPTLHRRSK